MVSLTFSWTTEAAVVMKASLLEFGIAPVDHDVPVFQLPDPPSQLSGVTVNGWAKGWTAKGCTAKPFPRISRHCARRPRCPGIPVAGSAQPIVRRDRQRLGGSGNWN